MAPGLRGRVQQSPDPPGSGRTPVPAGHSRGRTRGRGPRPTGAGQRRWSCCLLYTSDAADDM
eukprot:15010446-Alexandrium_andersonii.AAC.1